MPTIRRARPADLPTLAALQSELDAPSPDLLASFAAVGACLVAVPDGERVGVDRNGDATDDGRQPVGYVLVVGRGDADGDGGDAHLAELVVHPDHRREGYGRALVGAAIDRQAPGTRLTLLVAVDNGPARSLYESVGFRPIAYQPRFYEDGDGRTDAVVYAYDA
ncbi:GNAT family N-acetyltransferase [Halobellus rubicundus]|uniref:GNAT family N-acetyltransferase n=1 Tax=Halobellus rubicundus TaxID=2996466 RepID=A0ABD5MAK3_9EURY